MKSNQILLGEIYLTPYDMTDVCITQEIALAAIKFGMICERAGLSEPEVDFCVTSKHSYPNVLQIFATLESVDHAILYRLTEIR